MIFDGPGKDEDFGLEQITANSADRYKFRASPLRNAALQPAFFHNGSFTRLADAIRHHLDVASSARSYNPISAGLDRDLTYRLGPIEPVLARVHPLLTTPIDLRPEEFQNLVAFVRDGLLDQRATQAEPLQVGPQPRAERLSDDAFRDLPAVAGRISITATLKEKNHEFDAHESRPGLDLRHARRRRLRRSAGGRAGQLLGLRGLRRLAARQRRRHVFPARNARDPCIHRHAHRRGCGGANPRRRDRRCGQAPL